MKHIIIAILGLLIYFMPVTLHADSNVEYDPSMEEYIGTWNCTTSNIDGQWIPRKIEIKKKGDKLDWTFFVNTGKVPKSYYDGPYSQSWDGHFYFAATSIYKDQKPENQHKIKYDFKTKMTYDDRDYTNTLYILVTFCYYNEWGEIAYDDFYVRYEKEYEYEGE